MKELIKNTRKNFALLLMELPALILLVAFWLIPLFGVVIAFKRFNYNLGIFDSPWVGFDNFRFLIASKSVMGRLVRNTVGYYILFTAVGTVLNVGLALMINECRKKNFAKISHMIIIFPTFISYIAVSFIVYAILDTNNGVLNQILVAFGQNPVIWYQESKAWPFILLFVKVWKDTGYGCILYLSALAGMDREIFEAAELDGATRWQRIRYVTLPQLTSMISIMLLLGLGNIMTSSTGLFYKVTRNSSAIYSTTQTLDAYVLNALTAGGGNFGTMAAITLFQASVGAIITIVVNMIVRKAEPDNALF